MSDKLAVVLPTPLCGSHLLPGAALEVGPHSLHQEEVEKIRKQTNCLVSSTGDSPCRHHQTRSAGLKERKARAVFPVLKLSSWLQLQAPAPASDVPSHPERQRHHSKLLCHGVQSCPSPRDSTPHSLPQLPEALPKPLCSLSYIHHTGWPGAAVRSNGTTTPSWVPPLRDSILEQALYFQCGLLPLVIGHLLKNRFSYWKSPLHMKQSTLVCAH